MNWNEIGLHRSMGVVAMLTNSRYWWLHKREMGQLPPATEALPVMWIEHGRSGDNSQKAWQKKYMGDMTWGAEYWPSERVLDSMRNDSGRYDQGGTIGWFILVALSIGLGVWIGRMVWG